MLASGCATRLAVFGSCLLGAGMAFGQLQTPNIGPKDKVDVEAITVTQFGPYPTSIDRVAGPFILYVANRSGQLEDTFSLVVKPAAGSGNSPAAASLLDLHAKRDQHRDHQLIDLLPGSYQLRFKSHPAWVVEIKITAVK